MKQYQKTHTVLITVLVFLLATVPVWAEPEPEKDSISSAATEEGVETIAIQPETDVEATGLDIVLDGSSLESFESGLDKIKETATATEYETLEKSINYLLFYDLVAQRDRQKLAARLDGLTGAEVIEKVDRRRKR